jgi:hypothetical protein
MYPRHSGLAANAALVEAFLFGQLHLDDEHLAYVRHSRAGIFPPQQHAIAADILRKHRAGFPAFEPNHPACQPYGDAGAAAAIYPRNAFRVHDATLNRQGLGLQYRK